MLSLACKSARARFIALALLLVLSQLLLLAHHVLDDHDETVSCEICLQAKHVEFAAPAPAQSLWVLLATFVGLCLPALFAPVTRTAPGYSSRAPPH